MVEARPGADGALAGENKEANDKDSEHESDSAGVPSREGASSDAGVVVVVVVEVVEVVVVVVVVVVFVVFVVVVVA